MPPPSARTGSSAFGQKLDQQDRKDIAADCRKLAALLRKRTESKINLQLGEVLDAYLRFSCSKPYSRASLLEKVNLVLDDLDVSLLLVSILEWSSLNPLPFLRDQIKADKPSLSLISDLLSKYGEPISRLRISWLDPRGLWTTRIEGKFDSDKDPLLELQFVRNDNTTFEISESSGNFIILIQTIIDCMNSGLKESISSSSHDTKLLRELQVSLARLLANTSSKKKIS